jgi:Xaa-Pro aminopeptidase
MIDFDGRDGLLLVGDSERSSDLYYATKFRAPDPFVFLCTPQKSFLLVGDLELDRARAQAQVDEVLSLTAFDERLKAIDLSNADLSGADLSGGSRQQRALLMLLNDSSVRSLLVPADFPLETADLLRRWGIEIEALRAPLFRQRAIKQAPELEAIREALRVTDLAMEAALGTLRGADISADGTLLSGAEVLTSEGLRRIIHATLLEGACSGRHTIVACGEQGCDPHQEGSGPLHANLPIIIDIFPQSDETGYYGDLTRTVVKGRATQELRQVYDTVKEAQGIALARIRHGEDGGDIHGAVKKFFSDSGYETGEREGRVQGFFHGTGHGLGLDIHEPPSIGARRDILQSGQVVTVEPGLYYSGMGGVRLEDVVLVTDEGCENLTKSPKQLEL